MIIYYNPTTKEITKAAPVLLKTVSDPYIKVTGKELAMLEETGMHVQCFYVQDNQLHKKPDNSRLLINKPSFNDRHNIPIKNNHPIDFFIRQYSNRKQIELNLSEQAFSDKEKLLFAITLIACYNNDPHLPLWTLHIPPNTMSTAPLIYNYTGSDNIRFYTIKLYENYLHEQLS